MNKRQLVLDIETTGKYVFQGDRIISIALVEMIDLQNSGKYYYQEFNPETKQVDQESFNIHGLSNEYLQDKPYFREKASEVLAYIADSDLIIHNMHFDISFLSKELELAGHKAVISNNIICTVKLSRECLPINRVSLDNVANFFKIPIDSRHTHGALKDAYILSQVYIMLVNYKSRSNKTAINFNKLVSSNVGTQQLKLKEIEITSKESRIGQLLIWKYWGVT